MVDRISPENSDRLKQVAYAAIATIGVGALVNYARKNEQIRGYVYRLESDYVFVGLLREGVGKLAQFTGKLVFRGDQSDIEVLRDSDLTTADIETLEDIFIPEKKE